MIYVDLLVFQDLFMNYIAMLATGILLNRITKFKRLFLSSVIGTINIIFLFMNINKINSLIINFLFAIIMAVITFGYKDIVYTIKNILYMYFISIFLAGSIYLINTNILPKIDNYLLNMIVLVIISPIITMIYIKTTQSIKTNYSNYYKIDIYLKDKPKISLNAFLDTGNFLKDPYSHKPIILVTKKLISTTNEKIILVPYHTIDSDALIECFSPQKIYIEKVGYRKNVLIGLVNKQLVEGADCILNKTLLERIW